ncbi:hypothetical protein PACTADRAFT_51199 [Pachysolen tannophilus NRRL Y-2460]|uniref:Coatomer subunit epsilon n=1 Tax=Pachysolen tannophilus NRRL Y-2460 TaxID=669874 RepID=A0A1E4TRF4_PACTA|nr:hypothetical protein PACTADRAFT_51199 [Pachysolen tannophilus NRRL Y-2460]
MDPFSDSGELYQIRKQFFSGQYLKATDHQLDSFSEPAVPKVREYILRSHLILGNYEEVETGIQNIEDTDVSKSFELYTLFVKSNEKEPIEEFDDFLTNVTSDSEVITVLGSIYLARTGRIDEALKLLEKNSANNSMECISIQIQLRILTNRLDLALKDISNFSKIAQDDIVFNLTESWVNLLKGGSAYQSSFYFYEEISQSNTSLKNLICLLILNLQLHHLPESAEVIEQLKTINEADVTNGDLLANQITYYVLNGEFEKVDELREELITQNSEHPYIVDYNEKVALFDDIVAKYH